MNIRISIHSAGLSRFTGKLKPLLFSLVFVVSISGCASINNFFGSSGPSLAAVQEIPDDPRHAGIQFVNIDGAVAHKLAARRKQSLFSESFGDSVKAGYVIGSGDVLELSVWEAPPAMLFGAAAVVPGTGPSTSQVSTFPSQMVSGEGMINIPFAGQIPVAGRTPQQIEAEIAHRLKDKANQPQVLVRVIQNNTANVTVVGEVATSARVPLTARGERLLDALAAAGGVRQPVDKMTLQVTRGNQVQALALDTIIRDPKQNIVLQPGDVITALFQPLSFTVLGATAKNEEINFEAQGITLTQALARSGGFANIGAAGPDSRAVFIFRFEDRKALDWAAPPKTTPEGKVPVIYQMNMKDPAGFLVAQNFPIDNKDVLYVSAAPGENFIKFWQILYQSIFILRTIALF